MPSNFTSQMMSTGFQTQRNMTWEPAEEDPNAYRVITDVSHASYEGVVYRKDGTFGQSFDGDKKHPNPWSYSISESWTPFGTQYRGYKRGDGVIQTQLWSNIQDPGGIVAFADVNEDAVYNDALSNFYSQLRGDTDLSVSAFQAKQTVRMFNACDIADTYFRKTKFGLIKKSASAWLTWVYGLKPLVADIHAIAEESLKSSDNRCQFARGQASRTEKDELSDKQGAISQYARHENRVAYTIGASFNNMQDSVRRMTSLNPVSIAWELVPYSFVVDWFYDVGSLLRNGESAVLYAHNFQYGFISRLQIQNQFHQTSESFSESAVQGYTHANSRTKSITFSRNVMLGNPLPRPPQLDAKLGASRLLSTAALLGNLLGRGR